MSPAGVDGGDEASPAAFPPELDIKLSIENDTLTIALPAYTYAEGGSYKAILQLVTSVRAICCCQREPQNLCTEPPGLFSACMALYGSAWLYAALR